MKHSASRVFHGTTQYLPDNIACPLHPKCIMSWMLWICLPFTEQRYVIKATAMMPLSALLVEACSKMKPAMNPEFCQLLLAKKRLDTSLTFRLANIPAGSKIEVARGGCCRSVHLANLWLYLHQGYRVLNIWCTVQFNVAAPHTLM